MVKRTKARGQMTALVREFYSKHPTAKPPEAVQQLAKEGVHVSLATASSVKYAKRHKTGRRVARGRGVRAFKVKTTQNNICIEHLVAAKKFVDQIGLAAAQQALSALAKLVT